MGAEIQYAGWSGFYEILLIVLVLILIYNGLIRQRILKNVEGQMSDSTTKSKPEKKAKKLNSDKGEYVDFEVVDE